MHKSRRVGWLDEAVDTARRLMPDDKSEGGQSCTLADIDWKVKNMLHDFASIRLLERQCVLVL